MAARASKIDVYLEVGKKRTFAGATEWPGWCRRGRDEAWAVASLLDYGSRYASAIGGPRLGFRAPGPGAGVRVVERLKGDASTDFGAPAVAPSSDERSADDAELRCLGALLKACWEIADRSG